MTTGNTLQLRRHIDLPFDRAAQLARSLQSEAAVAVVLHGPHGYLAVNAENSIVGTGCRSLSEAVSGLETAGWVVGWLADDVLLAAQA